MDELLGALRKSDDKTDGIFYPHLYCVGTLENPDRFVNDERYVSELADTVKQGDYAALLSALSIHHELNHLSSYVSTNFGAEAYVALHQAARSFLTSGELPRFFDAPVLRHTDIHIDDAHNVAHRFMLYALKELSAESVFQPKNRNQNHMSSFELWGFPHGMWRFGSQFGLAPDWFDAQQMNIAEAISRSYLSPPICDYYIVNEAENAGSVRTCLNAATLFEALATLAEIDLISSLTPNGITREWAADYINNKNVMNQAAIFVYHNMYHLPFPNIQLHLPALIDIALMYTPMIARKENAGRTLFGNRAWWTPMDVFFEACAAARDVELIGDLSYRRGAVTRFQDAVCQRMGIPTVYELAEAGVAFLKHNYSTAFDPTTRRPGAFDITAPFAIHLTYLEGRVNEPLDWCSRNLRISFSRGIAKLYQDDLIFYDLDRKERIWLQEPDTSHLKQPNANPMTRNTFGVQSVGNLLVDLLSGRAATCPLKEGRPFKCWSHGYPSNVFCTIKRGDAEVRCPYTEFFGLADA